MSSPRYQCARDVGIRITIDRTDLRTPGRSQSGDSDAVRWLGPNAPRTKRCERVLRVYFRPPPGAAKRAVPVPFADQVLHAVSACDQKRGGLKVLVDDLRTGLEIAR